MDFKSKSKHFKNIMKVTALLSGTGLFMTYHIYQTRKFISNIVNDRVLDTERKHIPEYIYINDPTYSIIMKKEQEREKKESKHFLGSSRIWRSLKHSLAWRLLWLCRHGNKDQRNLALHQLASFRNCKDWDCLKLAQAMDKNTAVLLARTRGADVRYFLPPPIHIRRSALDRRLLSFEFRDIILAIQQNYPHSCLQQFLNKYFTTDQETNVEADSVPVKPDSISERDLCIQCLNAIHHHISLFSEKSFKDDITAVTLIKMGILPKLAELLLRNHNDKEIDLAVLGVLTVLSVHSNLLTDFFENGLIRELCRLVKSNDVRLASSAAVCLSNLSGEFCYRPGLYVLHPIYRTIKPHKCDTLLVHGLRGGVFVTWRQRDKKFTEPIGPVDDTVTDVGCEPCEEAEVETRFLDPEMQQVVEDMIEYEDELILSEYEVALHDIPVNAKREPTNSPSFTASRKKIALDEELKDKYNYTYCWPKDWLPKNCKNLRILGVNYWSSLSNWLEHCPVQGCNIEGRASELLHNLVDAGVGSKDIPIIWLAHSMGGLIVKQLLIEAAQGTDTIVNRLCDNTKALFFYSTPHKGSSIAKMPLAASAILWPSNDVRQLQENSPTLLNIQKTFIDLADVYKWEIISFVETNPTLVTAFKVPVQLLQPDSADLGRGPLYELPLDHLSICKPATRQSILYTSVLSVIQTTMAKEGKYEFSNPFLIWLIDLLTVRLKEKANEGIEKIYGYTFTK